MIEPHTEPCTRCRTKGTRYAHVNGALTSWTCKACGGTGERTFTQPAEKRAITNAKARERKARKLAEGIEAFKAENPQVWAWMERAAEGTFAANMRAALMRWGGLTEKQLAAAKRHI